jgi:hypothetical protein
MSADCADWAGRLTAEANRRAEAAAAAEAALIGLAEDVLRPPA